MGSRPRTTAALVPGTAPPSPGSYNYTVTSEGQASPVELVVDGRGNSYGALLLEEDWSTDSGTERRGEDWSSRSEQELWSSDGTYRCDYTPPTAWLELPLSVGGQWQGSSSCRYASQDGQPVRQQQSVATRVVSGAHADYQGRRTYCWVIERDVLTTVTTPGAVATSETRTTDLFAPALGLVLFQTGKTEFPDASGSVQSYSWTEQLDG